MKLKRSEFIKELDNIIGLVKTLQTAVKEEPEKLDLQDIKDLTNLVESRLINTINLFKE